MRCKIRSCWRRVADHLMRGSAALLTPSHNMPGEKGCSCLFQNSQQWPQGSIVVLLLLLLLLRKLPCLQRLGWLYHITS